MALPEHTPEFTLLEEAITILFCLIDDTYRILNPKGRQYAALKQFSDSEVVTLALFQQLRGIESERSSLREAARPKCSSSATATKYLMWLSSISASYSLGLSIAGEKFIRHPVSVRLGLGTVSVWGIRSKGKPVNTETNFSLSPGKTLARLGRLGVWSRLSEASGRQGLSAGAQGGGSGCRELIEEELLTWKTRHRNLGT
jgi:hypothetical protein